MQYSLLSFIVMDILCFSPGIFRYHKILQLLPEKYAVSKTRLYVSTRTRGWSSQLHERRDAGKHVMIYTTKYFSCVQITFKIPGAKFDEIWKNCRCAEREHCKALWLLRLSAFVVLWSWAFISDTQRQFSSCPWQVIFLVPAPLCKKGG